MCDGNLVLLLWHCGAGIVTACVCVRINRGCELLRVRLCPGEDGGVRGDVRV